jgi:hypothetical protein
MGRNIELQNAEEIYCDLLETLSWYTPWRTEKHHEKPQGSWYIDEESNRETTV